MTLTRALGEHLPRTLGDVAEHQNRLDWLTSTLISSLALIKCYQQSSADLKSEILYLKEKILAMQEAQPHDGQDRFRPRKKAKGTHSPEVVVCCHCVIEIDVNAHPSLGAGPP